MAKQDSIGLAHDIAVILRTNRLDGPDACAVLAMAMGIYCEADGGYREMIPLAEALNSQAQFVFDVMRARRRGGVA